MDRQLTDAGFTHAEHSAMTAALKAAEHGVRGANPVVGAVLLDAAGHVRHVAHHAGAGTAHAEIALLEQIRAAGTDIGEATVVVTLEPCHHSGRTGPCSTALLDAGVRDLIYAMHDPTARAAGGGSWLAARGVRVRHGLGAHRARHLNHRWLCSRERSRPFVTLKIAQSVDGRVAAPDGTSRWITGPEARQAGHGLRERADAILVGGGTLRTDDPSLTARDDQGRLLERQPLRAVMSRTEVPDDARVRSAGGGQFCRLSTHDPAVALAELSRRGVDHVLVEGGPTVAGAFLAQDLVDELWLHQAPVILGEGPTSVAGTGLTSLGQAGRWAPDPVGGPPVTRRGQDLVWHLAPEPRGGVVGG